jgi:hypothetical protein
VACIRRLATLHESTIGHSRSASDCARIGRFRLHSP